VRSSVARFSRNDSQDLVQEAMARALRHNVTGNLEPWLKTVSRRIATDNSRRAREYATGGAAEVERLIPPAATTPEDVVINNESVGLIRRAMHSLPARYSDALVAYADERENGAVAARLGISSNATGSLLCRARARLRQELDRVGYAFGAVVMKLQRWNHEVATATAVACFVGAVALSGGPAASAVHVTPAPAVAAPAHPGVVAYDHHATPIRVTRVVAVHSSPPVAAVKAIAKRVEIRRFQVDACGPDGKQLPTPYVSVVREGRASLVGKVAAQLPQIPLLTVKACAR
jgi:RNA polymerase sigma factor (sigma-70 family)